MAVDHCANQTQNQALPLVKNCDSLKNMTEKMCFTARLALPNFFFDVGYFI